MADHLLLDTQIEEILIALDAQDAKELAALWPGFTRRLLQHMDIEERCLFPHVDERVIRGARALHEEHRYIRARCCGLAEAVNAAVARSDELRAFADELRAHASHEDRMLYTWADQQLDQEARAALLRQLEEVTALLLSERHSAR